MENDFNPWKVKSLEDFTLTYVVYSCPECQRTFSTSEQFIGHAMMSHPKARDTLPAILNIQDEEKSDIREKSMVNHDLVEVVEVKEESDLESLEIKSDITEKSLVNPDCVEVQQAWARFFDKKRKAEDNGYEDASKKPKFGGGYCFNCGKYGHFFRKGIKCPEPKVCFNCRKPGHVSKECTETAGSHSKMLCFNCNTIGHIARNCDKPRVERSGFGRIPKII